MGRFLLFARILPKPKLKGIAIYTWAVIVQISALDEAGGLNSHHTSKS